MIFLSVISGMDKSTIISEYLQGANIRGLATKYSMNRAKVTKILTDEKIKIRASRRKHLVRNDFFDVIDTEAKAYFLGLFIADGHVDLVENKFTLCLTDEDIIRCFSNLLFLTPEKKIYIREPRTEKHQRMFATVVRSEQICKAFDRMGLAKNKTFDGAIPAVPEHLERHLLRGLIDGDGYFTVTKNRKNGAAWGLTGNQKVLERVNEIIQRHLNFQSAKLYTTNSSAKGIYKWMLGQSAQCRALYDWLYTGATIFMNRKKNKCDAFFTLR